MHCQIFSLKLLPAPGTLSSKQRNWLKRSPAFLPLGGKHWQLAGSFGKGSFKNIPTPTLQTHPGLGHLPPRKSKGQEIKRGGMAVTAWHSPLHTLPRNA